MRRCPSWLRSATQVRVAQAAWVRVPFFATFLPPLCCVMKQMDNAAPLVGPPNLRRRRDDDDDDDEERRPRRAPRRVNEDLQMTLRAERMRMLQERIQRIRTLFVFLRNVAGLDYYVAREVLLMAFDADEVAIAFVGMPASLAAPGAPVAGI